MYYHAENECRGNYVVVDSQGENVKIFEIPHVQEEEEEEDDSKLEEVEIDFSKNSQEEEDANNKPVRKKSLLSGFKLESKDKDKISNKKHGINSKSAEKALDENVEHSQYVNTKKFNSQEELNNAFNGATEDNAFNKAVVIKEEDFAPENEADNEVKNEKMMLLKKKQKHFAPEQKIMLIV